MTRAVITGIGHGVPSRVLDNFELEKIVETNDEWIVQRTGIKERRVCDENETASTLSIEASREALEDARLSPEAVDTVICGTVTGDMPFPATACLVQAGIGALNASAFDVGAACAGFITSLAVATALIESGAARNVVVIGVDVLTKYLDWTDRSTCVLFGDAAGAVVVQAQEGTDRGVMKTVMAADGRGAAHIDFEVGGSRYPINAPESEGKRRKVHMNGQEVYRFAVKAMNDACCRTLDEAGLTPADVDLFVPHQANLRIIRAAQERLGLPDDRVFVNVDRYGNTSGGSIPLALYEAKKTGRLKVGDTVMTVGFGAGLVWGANLIRW
ncbi:MAG: ketoacyl-ACP synthase III [Fimbriimonadaceae bacterium]|nr:ketoacyl-ACP synthase III [Fimbriimonadaceae bacterium]QYK56370.1 MAG: ketoacyl-ACP synthase III [Fimbriimonadaceae bacterium]